MNRTKQTDEQKRTTGERTRRQWEDPEYRARQIEKKRGRKHSEETKRKISESNLGKKMSAESRAKMSAAKKGIPKTEEWKQGVSAKTKGRVMSAETRQRMSTGQKALFNDPEYRKRRGEQTRRFWATLTPEEKSKIALPGRLACLEATRHRAPTKIEGAVAAVLDHLGVQYEQQILFKYYVADIYLPDHNTIIECDGDYWHSTPKMIAHDKKRDRWFTKHGIGVIRLWERDIKADARGCVEQALRNII